MWAWKHRSVLEAGVRDSGGGVRTGDRQRPTYQTGAGPQDRREGRGVDRRSVGAWTNESQFPTAAGDSRTARSDPLPAQVGGEPERGTQPFVEGAGDGQHQTGECGQRCLRGFRAVDGGGVGGRRSDARGDGGVGEGETAREASATGVGVGRKGGGTSPLPAAIATEALAGGGRRPRATRSAPARETGTVSGAGSAAAGDSWSGQHAGRHHHRGTWRRYERVSVGLEDSGVGWGVTGQSRIGGQTPQWTSHQGQRISEDCFAGGCFRRLAQEGQLPAGEVLSTQSTAGTQTGSGGYRP